MSFRRLAALPTGMRVTLPVLLAACSDPAPPALTDRYGPPPDTATAPSPALTDPGIPPAIAGREGWNYHQSAAADLDGDGRAERIVLTARVELYRGQPAWDDGQPWQVYVESAGGERTYVYAQRLQLGGLTMRVGLAAPPLPATVILLEHLPDQLSVYEISYRGPGQSSAVTRFQRRVDPRGETANPRFP